MREGGRDDDKGRRAEGEGGEKEKEKDRATICKGVIRWNRGQRLTPLSFSCFRRLSMSDSTALLLADFISDTGTNKSG
jgi:hypothetical protein